MTCETFCSTAEAQRTGLPRSSCPMNEVRARVSAPNSPMIADSQIDFRSWKSRKLRVRSEEHTSELQSLMRISYAVFCLKKKTKLAEQYHTRQRIHIQKVKFQ